MSALESALLGALTGHGVALPVAVFALVGAVVFVSASRLARHAEAIADATGLGRVWVGRCCSRRARRCRSSSPT